MTKTLFLVALLMAITSLQASDIADLQNQLKDEQQKTDEAKQRSQLSHDIRQQQEERQKAEEGENAKSKFVQERNKVEDKVSKETGRIGKQVKGLFD